MERYSIIENKFNREIVLLKGTPCKWGRCSFCDYILDNSTDIKKIEEENREILDKVTGKYSRLEVINSGSVFELPKSTLNYIKEIALSKGIKELVFEAHWMYKNRLDEIRKFFEGMNIVFKTGIETFDDYFRNKVFNKGIVYKNIEEVSSLFDSVCILCCVQGQTREMIKRDIEIATTKFKRCTINVFNNNSTEIKRDEELVKWFVSEFGEKLNSMENAELLVEITDFGVGDLQSED